ncbi:hypothetical protein LVL57_000298 [Listeria monocytogenes]|nr:hypothetical protein [Listeria monocytogenes]EIQ6261006.1 hypothetical protein [Listeria monocytogenes]EIQ6315106.1 hypothetical protein [Listeria monocytogenes]OFG45785.1 hypothetical protein BJM66_08520 [Listeria monocytogenes]
MEILFLCGKGGENMLQIDDWVELISEIEDDNVNVGSLLQVVDITLDKKEAWVRPDYRILSIPINKLRKV